MLAALMMYLKISAIAGMYCDSAEHVVELQWNFVFSESLWAVSWNSLLHSFDMEQSAEARMMARRASKFELAFA